MKAIYESLLIAVFLINLVHNVSAENWYKVAVAEDNKVETFVDVDTIKYEGNVGEFWMYHDFKGTNSYDGKPIEKASSLSVVNCQSRTIGYTEVILEFSDGNKKKSKMKLEEKPVLSGSVDEAVLVFVCEQ